MNLNNNLDYDCDFRFAFNLRSQGKQAVGYLLMFTGLGGLNLRKDIELWNPYHEAGQLDAYNKPTIQCIGAIESFRFSGNENDPIRLVSYVSRGTAADVRSRLARPLSNLKLKVSWYVIDFDDDSKAWYDAAFIKDASGTDANLSSRGGQLQLGIASRPEKIDDSLDIGLYRMEFEVLPPEGGSTSLEFATGPRQKLVRRWTSTED